MKRKWVDQLRHQQQVRIFALAMAQRGPFTADQFYLFFNPGSMPKFDPRYAEKVRGTRKSLWKLLNDGDLVKEGDLYSLKRTARNGLIVAFLPIDKTSRLAPLTKDQLMGGRPAPARRAA